MQVQDSPQHFFDTSVVRSLLLGTQAYQQYFNSNLAERPLYISNYIQMEMKRSYLMNIISFYFVLRLETIQTIGDAITFWSNRFKTSQLKAILQLIPQLFSTHQLDFSRSQDKESASEPSQWCRPISFPRSFVGATSPLPSCTLTHGVTVRNYTPSYCR